MIAVRRCVETDTKGDSTSRRAEGRAHNAGWLRTLNLLVTDVFIGALVLYLALLVIEVLRRDAAAYFVNLNAVMWVVLGTGALAVLTSGARDAGTRTEGIRDVPISVKLLAVGLAVAEAVFVLLATLRLGSVSLLLSLGVGFILILVVPLFAE